MLRVSLISFFILGAAAVGGAQPAPEPKVWTVLASAGLAFTSGNTDTSTENAAYDITYDPRTNNVIKSDGILIRGKTAGVLSTNRLALNARDEHRLTGRTFVFGQNQYLRDEFKSIDYLTAPAVGLGYKLFDTDRRKLSVDGGIGSVWEKNTGRSLTSSGALTAGERLMQSVTATTTATESFSGLWKTGDLGDALYTFAAGVAAAMSTHTQLKVELIDVLKNKPPVASVKKNDVALVIAFVYKS